MKTQKSLTFQLLKVTFSIYVIVTISITVIQMYTEWIEAEKFLQQDLFELGNSSKNGIVLAVWDLDYTQVDLIAEGLLALHIVIGIEIKDKKIKKLYGIHGDLVQEYELIHEEEEGVTYHVGKMIIYSSRQIVFNRIKNSYILIIVNAIVKTIALWLIVLWVGKKLITKPLTILTEATKSFETGDDEFSSIRQLGLTNYEDEIGSLAKSFDKMRETILKKIHDLEVLDEMNRSLSSSLEIEKVGHTLIRTIMCHLTPETGAFYIRDQTTPDKFGLVYQTGTAAENLQKEIHIDNDLSKLLELRRMIQNYSSSSLSEEDTKSEKFREIINNLHAELCFPVMSDEEVMGLCFLGANVTGKNYEISNLDLATKLVQQSVSPLRNCQYYLKLKEFNQDLEKMVDRRTSELQQTLKELKQTQTQLVQSEKMAGLGTLVAGIAHETNNPVNFVHVSARTLDTELQEHKTFLFELLEEEKELLEDFEIKFDRFFHALADINEGSTRIKTIVSDLRTFSRLDEADRKKVNIVEGIRSTLRLIETQYKKTARFVCDFQAEPELYCWPAQLNQVFMNMMVNACQAIEVKQKQTGNSTPGTLTFRTFLQENSNAVPQIGISFIDTGCGMTEEVKKKIFDPFFTTKTVGEGTGMGMSISFGIIEKHQGHFEVESTHGEGSNITIFLPLHPRSVVRKPKKG